VKRAGEQNRRSERKKSDAMAKDPGRKPSSERQPITEREVEDIEERSSPRTPVIYEIVSRLGRDEMERPATSLWWSGVAAGLSISFSLLTEAVLQLHLADTPWRPLVTDFGYSVGFIIVVLARQQLFTETTITVVLPVMARLNQRNIWLMGRMWAIVLVANLAGTLFAAAFCSFTPAVAPDLRAAMIEISRSIFNDDPVAMFFKAIGAGFLMAAMVWVIPSAESAQIIVITLITYLIAVGGFPHIVAGSMEAFMLAANNQLEWMSIATHFMLPVLAGNIVGGTALFALISYAQVMKEI
jgi:formate/nitrite transporter FocA (FNT family)